MNNSLGFVNSRLLNFTVTRAKDWLIHGGYDGKQTLNAVGYVLDDKSYGPFTTNNDLASPLNYYENITLSQGSHTLRVYGNATGCIISGISDKAEYVPIVGWSDTITFNTLPLKQTINVQPVEINGRSLNLNFTIDEPISMITYSIDNQGNATIAGNTTLTKLSYGHHEMTVYATNPAGNVGVSQAIYFNVAVPFPTVTVARCFSGISSCDNWYCLYFTL